MGRYGHEDVNDREDSRPVTNFLLLEMLEPWRNNKFIAKARADQKSTA
jgi:hypothetical protein